MDIRGRKCIHAEAKKGYIWHPRGITALLDETFQESRENGLPEKIVQLVCDEQYVQGKTVHYTLAWRRSKNVAC